MIKAIFAHIKHFLRKNKRDNVPAIAAQSSFFIVLSFVPFLLFIFAISSLLSGDSSNIYNSIPRDSGNQFIFDILKDAYQRAAGAAVYTIVIALWSSAKGMYAITDGVRRIYRLPDKHPWLLKRIFSMGYTVILFFLLIILLAATTVMALTEDFILPYVESFPFALQVLFALRYIVLFSLLVVLMTLALKIFLLRKVSDRRFAKFRVLLPGMAGTALGWMLFSIGISVYTKYFGGASIYGKVSSVIVLLIWVYFSMYILLCGIQLNYIYRKKFLNFRFRKLFSKKEK